MIMKCRVHPEQFAAALNAFQAFFRANAKNSATVKVPALRMKTAENLLTLTGVDYYMDAAFEIEIPCVTENAGEVIIDNRDIVRERNRLRKEGITSFTTIVCEEPAKGYRVGQMRAQPVVPYAIFPEITEQDFAEWVSFEKDVLATACKSVKFAVADSDLGAQLNHVLLSPNEDVMGARIGATDIVATNRWQFAVARIASQIPAQVLLRDRLAAGIPKLFATCGDTLCLGINTQKTITDTTTQALFVGKDVLAGMKTQLLLSAAAPTGFPLYRSGLPDYTTGSHVSGVVERKACLQAIRDTLEVSPSNAKSGLTRLCLDTQDAQLRIDAMLKTKTSCMNPVNGVSTQLHDDGVSKVIPVPLLRVREQKSTTPWITARYDTALLLETLNAFNACERLVVDLQTSPGAISIRDALSPNWKSAPLLAMLAPFGN